MLKPDSKKTRKRLLTAFFSCLLAFAFLFLDPNSAHAKKTQTPGEIKRALETEKDKAKETQANVNKLTEKERALNSEMAKAEDSIAGMQKKIDQQEKELAKIESAQGINQRQYDDLIVNRSKTEADLAELMRFLWPVSLGPCTSSLNHHCRFTSRYLTDICDGGFSRNLLTLSSSGIIRSQWLRSILQYRN